MRTVVFDLDGTLADTSGDLVAAANACFRGLGVAIGGCFGGGGRVCVCVWWAGSVLMSRLFCGCRWPVVYCMGLVGLLFV